MLVFAFSLFNLLLRWVEKVGKFDYCFQVLFRMNFKIMYFLMKILGNTPSAVSTASRDSLSSQNATWGIVFFSSFYWWHIEYNGWMCERLLNLQEIYVSGQNICIEVYGNSVGTITPVQVRIFWTSNIFVIIVFPYTHDTGAVTGTESSVEFYTSAFKEINIGMPSALRIFTSGVRYWKYRRRMKKMSWNRENWGKQKEGKMEKDKEIEDIL